MQIVSLVFLFSFSAFSASPTDQASVCNRTKGIRLVLESTLQKSCAQIMVSDLNAIEKLSFEKKGITSIQAQDFQYLNQLKSLTLSGNRLTTLPDNVFAGLPQLEDLILSHNAIQTLPKKSFHGIANLQLLALDHNQLTVLPEGLFTELTSLDILNLSSNHLTTLSGGSFQELSKDLLDLNLKDNKLSTSKKTLKAQMGERVHL